MSPLDPADRIVAAQAATAAGLLWPGRPRWSLPAAGTALAVAASVAGAVLGLLGALPHGRRLTPKVAPPDDAELIRTGPYAISRNPIYAGLLAAGGGVAVLRRRPEPLLAWIALAVVLTVKVRREETRLAARFGAAYEDYRQSTPRFLGPR